jgi:hypothetical protein
MTILYVLLTLSFSSFIYLFIYIYISYSSDSWLRRSNLLALHPCIGITYSDTVFCFADTVVLLYQHSDFATKTHHFPAPIVSTTNVYTVTLLITPTTNHLHALSHVAVASAVASAVAIRSPSSPPGYIHVGIRCGGLFFGYFP